MFFLTDRTKKRSLNTHDFLDTAAEEFCLFFVMTHQGKKNKSEEVHVKSKNSISHLKTERYR